MPAWEENAEQISQIEAFTYIGRHLRQNGSEFSVEVNTIPFHYDGNEYYLSLYAFLTWIISRKSTKSMATSPEIKY